MKLNFTKKEYKKLLEALYISDWVLNAHREEQDSLDEEYKELEQKILAAASEFGLPGMVERSAGIGNFFPSRKFIEESKVMEKIEKYENATFWEELLERLARRDFIKTYGKEAILKMSIEERFEKETQFQKQYDQEFGEHGLDALCLEKDKK